MIPNVSVQSVIVSDKSYASDDPYDIINSNISFVNALLEAYFNPDEISSNAFRSYYVDYYLAQLKNGGFSQFVYNSRWNEQVVTYVREGLVAMDARYQLAFFEQGAELVTALGQERLERFFESDYFDENAERDFLNALNDQFAAIDQQENLIILNANWLRQLPDLVVLPIADMEAEVKRRSEALPDRDERIAYARSLEPEYMKYIRALCEQVGYELSRVTGANPRHKHAGQRMFAWFFITDHGPHYMIEANGKAQMFEGTTQELVSEISLVEG